LLIVVRISELPATSRFADAGGSAMSAGRRAAFLMAIAAWAAPAFADEIGTITAPPPVRVHYGTVSLEASIGTMQGEANEYVYRLDGSKLSQLVWSFDNVPVFNGGIAINPLSWLTLGARFRTALADGGATMDDYDWVFGPGENKDDCPGDFCHSHHTNTKLETFLSVDAYAAATFYSNDWIALTALAGYKRDSQSWQSRDGWANYTTWPPGTLVIAYKQNFEAPYIGAQFNAEWNRWSLQGRVIGSWWVNGEDHDDHAFLGDNYYEPFGQSNMVGANARLGYRLTANLLLTADYDMQDWMLAKGPSTKIDADGDTTYSTWNAAGANSLTQTVSFGAVLEY
jgi:outer membrane protease